MNWERESGFGHTWVRGCLLNVSLTGVISREVAFYWGGERKRQQGGTMMAVGGPQ